MIRDSILYEIALSRQRFPALCPFHFWGEFWHNRATLQPKDQWAVYRETRA
jgi:hypothetical protein